MKDEFSNSDEQHPAEVLPPSAIMAMERAMIDTQVATAHQYPRSLELFKKRALSMATLDEDTADSCIYVRPVGKEKNEKGQWVEKYAEGPSIRLAEIVGASYGNLRVSARIVEQTERFVRCEGVAHDLESNFAAKSEVMESTVTKEGKPYSERQRALTAKVCLAKALRDATFRVVPRALCKPVFNAAKSVSQGKDKPLEERRKKAQAWIGSLKIDEARVLTAMGVNGWSEINDDHLLKLTGLKTAMGDGDITIDEAFPPVAKSPEPTPMQKATQNLKNEKKPAGNAPGTTGAPTPTPTSSAPQTSQAPGKAPQGTPKSEESGGFDAAQENPAEKTTSEGELAQTTGEGGTEPGEDEAALAAADLAPATEAVQERPPFVPNPGESPELQAVHAKMWIDSIGEDQILAWTLSAKLRKENQKSLAELSGAKLDSIARNWASVVGKIKAVTTA